MQSEEQRLIDGLFSRLQQAESNTAPRDAEAERVIQAHIRQQPSAPYYMAQAMIIQEAALTKLNAQVQELQQQVEQLQQQAQTAKPQSSGFLAGLFGGGASQPAPQRPASQGSQPIPGTQGWGAQPQQPQYAQQPQQQAPAQAAPQQPGFLGSALRTAAGVAGGVVLADMLTGMFHHSQPQEIVNIIEEPPVQDLNPADSSFLDNSQGFDSNQPSWEDASLRNDNADLGFGNDDFDTDDFNNDDDSFF
ncbi:MULTISPECIES: DUF2076 domain-containing protein [Rahnella]|jgi:hypothetical protein|uniref:DUF2076 domain-containing protein n=1 Tax=Rahnella victoriana TaxID=1510570 RepID=A0ABS0DLN6_9GAMM|nr:MULTISPECIES: DUF2076 domain-containing protein [Rahnella]VTQ53975.1 Uncharacterized protein conserved in bacteria (DUF2076) [Campylobacter jejuni]MBF7954812.1 DUF2076 domain-containing protein [Rahnella victoriana]PBI82268.1 ABC transporter substrate-binding protein [Rahnella victoriana]TBX37449.1 DUF2076 domain-containing protein [Rahnella victoriana]TDS96899.1 hypothetical protein EDF78_102432 [Rahnella sp. BIGb0236]